MNIQFGPWTTAIDTGSTAQLSSFWKRRLAMLPRLRNCPRSCSRCAVLLLISLTVAALALPNLKSTPDSLALGGDSTKLEAPSSNAPPSVEFFPPPSEAEKRIEAALDAPVSVEFNDTPLTDALEYLHKRTGANLFLDKKALAEDGGKSGEKMFLRAKDVPLRNVLRMTLSQANLEFVVVDDALKVTTHAEAEQRQIVRAYPVADLITTDMGPDFASLIEIATSVVDPTSWDENGGPATVRANFDSKSVIISQTYANHKEILSLLRSLRAAKAKQQGGKKSTAPTPAARTKAQEFRVRLEAKDNGQLADVRLGDRSVENLRTLQKEINKLAVGMDPVGIMVGDVEVVIEAAPALKYTLVRDAVTAIERAFAPKQVKITFKVTDGDGAPSEPRK